MEPGRPNNAIEVVNEASKLVQLSRDIAWGAVDPQSRPAATGTLGSNLTSTPGDPEIPHDDDVFHVDSGGGGMLSQIDYSGSANPTSYAALRPFIEAAIRSANPDDPLLAGAVV